MKKRTINGKNGHGRNGNGTLSIRKRRVLLGAGGGGKGAAGGIQSISEAEDTLASEQIVAFKDVLGEGEFQGFEHPEAPLRDIILDGVPVENPDTITVASITFTSGSDTCTTTSTLVDESLVNRTIISTKIPANTGIVEIKKSGATSTLTLSKKATSGGAASATIGGQLNFTDFDFYFVSGTQDQDFLPDFDAEENSSAVGVRVREALPWVHTVTNLEANAIRVDVRVPRLQQTITSGDKIGDVIGAKVDLEIWIDPGADGGYVKVLSDAIDGKASNPYVRTYKIDLAPYVGPWSIKVVRVTPDSTSQSLSNDTYVDAVTEVIYGKLSHPNTAMVGVHINAKQFASIPTRGYRVRGVKIKVPINYTPYEPKTNTPAVYSEPWNGVFKVAWSSNPAWIWYDMATNKRYGLGNYLAENNIDKWTLYSIAKYCDEMVTNGFGGTEPRFTCSIYIQAREEALKVMTDMASVFRAVLLYASGIIVPIQDRLADPIMIFSPQNVIDGRFSYSGSSRRARHTTALVYWNDQEDNGVSKPEYVESDQATIAQYGIVQQSITAFGCTSRGQAHRLGRHLLAAEKILDDTVSFGAGQMGFFCKPGSVIAIQDPFRAGQNLSGLIVSHTGTSVTLDRSVTLLAGKTYTFSFMRSTDDVMASATVTSAAGVRTVLTLNLAPSVTDGTPWQLAYDALQPALYRVISMVPHGLETCQIVALEYNASIYGFVEDNLNLVEPPITTLPPPGVLPPQLPFTFEDIAIIENGVIRRQIRAIWIKSKDTYLSRYEVNWRVNSGNWTGPLTVITPEITINLVGTGTYNFSVVAVNVGGQKSPAIIGSHFVDVGNPVALFEITGLELFGQGNVTDFNTLDAKFVWRLNSPAIPLDFDELKDGIDDPTFQSFHVTIWLGGTGAPGTGTMIWGPVYPKTPIFIFTHDMNAQAMNPALATPTFRIEVRALDVYNGITEPATLTVQNPPPAAPVNFIVYSAFQSAFLEWTSSNDVDLANIEIYRWNNTKPTAPIIYQLKAVRNSLQRFTDTGLVTGEEYEYWLRSQDTFGTFSDYTAGATTIPGTVQAKDLDEFAIDATKIFSNTIVPQGLDFVNNSPTGGSIAWYVSNIVYRGVTYPIAAGSTAKKYVYWRGPKYTNDDPAQPLIRAAMTAFATSDTNPSDLADWINTYDFQIAVNRDGIYELAWYGFANAVIGSAYIQDAAIVNAKIANLSVDDAKIAEAGISKLAADSVNANTLEVGLNTVDLQLNSSFEQEALTPNGAAGWSMISGGIIVTGSYGGVSARDGKRHLVCSDAVIQSGAQSTDFIPVLPSAPGAPSIYTVSGWVRVGDASLDAKIGIVEYTAGSATDPPTLIQTTYIFNGLPGNVGVWQYLSGQITLQEATFHIKVRALSGTNTPLIGKHIRFDNVRCCQIIPDEQLTGILANKITTGQIKSFDFLAGSKGWQIDLEGVAEFSRVIVRDQLLAYTLVKPTFTNDVQPGPPVVIAGSFTYDVDTFLSLRVNCTAGRRVRYTTTGIVRQTSPFWPEFDQTGTIDPGTGPDDFVGFLQSNADGTSPFKKSTVWHVCECDDPKGNGSWDRLGPENQITTNYVPVDTNKWPIVPTPYIYRTDADVAANPNRGTANYIVRADCMDGNTDANLGLVTLLKSTDGKTFSITGRGTGHTFSTSGLNVYFKAIRAYNKVEHHGYRDSQIAFFGNTLTGLPVSNDDGTPGGGGTGTPQKNEP